MGALIAGAKYKGEFSDAVRRSRAGLQDQKRPVVSFIFIGTTGVGKTELARALAEFLFNLLLQVLDEGRLTDNKGRTVNFRNVIIIMTSNLGSDIIRDRMEKSNNDMSENEQEQLRKDIFTLLRKSLRPEFLNRVDEIVMFKPLTLEQIEEIVRIQLNVIIRMLDTQNINLEVTDEAVKWLSEKGYDPQSGARLVKRLMQKEIVNELSKEIIAGRIARDSMVKVSVSIGKLVFSAK